MEREKSQEKQLTQHDTVILPLLSMGRELFHRNVDKGPSVNRVLKHGSLTHSLRTQWHNNGR